MSEASLTERSTLTQDDPVYQLNPSAKPFIPSYALVVFVQGPQAGQIIGLNMGMNLFGRLEGNLLHDVNASRCHAQIFFNGTAYVIEDLDSTNGTYVNNKKIESDFILKHGDLIRIGETLLAFEILGEKDSRLSRCEPPVRRIAYPSNAPTLTAADLGRPKHVQEQSVTLRI